MDGIKTKPPKYNITEADIKSHGTNKPSARQHHSNTLK
jgi:hypothetical protein